MKYKKKYRPANAQTHRKRKYFALKFSSIVAIIFPAKVDLRRPVRPSPPTWLDGRRRAAKDRTAGYESQIKSGRNFTITVSRAGNRASATAKSVSITEMSCVFFHSYPPLIESRLCAQVGCVFGVSSIIASGIGWALYMAAGAYTTLGSVHLQTVVHGGKRLK